MSRPYGKIPRKGAKPVAAPPAEIQINIAGRHTIEQLSLELQRALARLQEHDVYGVQKVRIRLQPLDEQGNSMALWREDGQAIELIEIPEPPPEPPYRKD